LELSSTRPHGDIHNKKQFSGQECKTKAHINGKGKGDKKKTSRALNTCSGAIVRFSSLLQISFDSDDIKFMNSATQSESFLHMSDLQGNKRRDLKKNQGAFHFAPCKLQVLALKYSPSVLMILQA
jgi:hypothetical protein